VSAGPEAPERLFLVDAMGLLFRAHFAFAGRRLTTGGGLPTGALHGFLVALLSLLREERARLVAVAFDAPGPTFRHERYPAYKAARPETPPELLAQIPYLRRLVDAFGLARLEEPGLEADDLIGSLARRCVEQGGEAVIVSADKDFSQLIGPRVRQWVPPRGPEPARWIEEAQVEERFGVRPAQFVDYLALTGDASDGIPGVKGVGPKTAAALLRAHGSLAGIYARLEGIEPTGLRDRLAAGRADAELSRELATIRTDAAEARIEELRAPDPSSRLQLRALLRELELRRLEASLFPPAPEEPRQGSLLDDPALAAGAARRGGARPAVGGGFAAADGEAPGVALQAADGEAPGVALQAADGWNRDYRLLATREALAGFLAAYDPALGPLAIDTETTGLDARRASLVGVSLCRSPGQAGYIPLGHEGGGNLEIEIARELLAPLLAGERIWKVAQNLGFDLPVLARHRFELRGPLGDTMLASYIRDPEARHGLDDLCLELLRHRKIPIAALIGPGGAQRSMAQLAPEDVRDYACEDADAVARLWPILRRRVEEAQGWRLFEEVEMPLVPVLAGMEERGIALEPAILEALGERLEGEMAGAEEEIHRLAGRPFNVRSPKQLQVVLYGDLKLAPRRRTKTGYSTDQETLQELAAGHPLPRRVLEYRQLEKLKSTYIEALPRMRDPETGRVHTRFNQAVTATGRLSSSEPNLQNIPVRSALGREIRRAFVAPRGRLLLSADYSQIELRILAHLAEDADLLAAFRRGEDIHRATAARVFGADPGAVTAEMRTRAKAVNFGVIYGMGAPRLAAELGIPVKEAAAFIGDYFRKLPGVRAYVQDCVARARERGYAETLLGRRRYLPALSAPPGRDRAAAERMALNTTIQGSAADLIKAAMAALDRRLREWRPRAWLLLQVHDELLLEVDEEEREGVESEVRATMESIVELRAPLLVECGHGRSWYEAHA